VVHPVVFSVCSHWKQNILGSAAAWRLGTVEDSCRMLEEALILARLRRREAWSEISQNKRLDAILLM
jgi:hypothetical protein